MPRRYKRSIVTIGDEPRGEFIFETPVLPYRKDVLTDHSASVERIALASAKAMLSTLAREAKRLGIPRARLIDYVQWQATSRGTQKIRQDGQGRWNVPDWSRPLFWVEQGRPDPNIEEAIYGAGGLAEYARAMGEGREYESRPIPLRKSETLAQELVSIRWYVVTGALPAAAVRALAREALADEKGREAEKRAARAKAERAAAELAAAKARSEAAKRAAATRARNKARAAELAAAKARSEAAKRAAATRARNKADAFARRSKASKLGWNRRKANKRKRRK